MQHKHSTLGARIAMALLGSLVLSHAALADKAITQGDLKSSCDKIGGESFDLSASYGCILKGEEKAVFCPKSTGVCTVVTRASPAASRKLFSQFNEAAKK